MNTVIEVNNVSKTFGKNTNLNRVLDEACMYVAEGEFVSLMGASGSGKSTLLYLIQLAYDEHSPELIRTNAILSTLDCFYDVYDVKEGDGMYIAPENRVSRWY